MNLLLWPIAQLFGAIVALRNFLFDRGLLHSQRHDLPLICIGNLAVGGTGKTPHTEHIASLLLARGKQVGILSRGYGRRTRGFRWVKAQSKASEVGDEPLQMRQQLPQSQLHCAVCENRNQGLHTMRQECPQLEVVLLDDAFQHRWVQPTLSIVLTDYARPYDQDQLLPAGRLREPKCSASRAQMIIVTRCPAKLSQQEAQALEARLRTSDEQAFFFTSVAYAPVAQASRALLITGIAHPAPLVEHLEAQGIALEHLQYPDHHRFSPSDRATIVERSAQYDCLLTTAKDAVRLDELDLPSSIRAKLHIVRIRPHFLFEQEEHFINSLLHHV